MMQIELAVTLELTEFIVSHRLKSVEQNYRSSEL